MKVVIAIFSKPFEAQCHGSRAKHEENERDVHIVEILIILKLHSKKISNYQELIQSDPIPCPQNQKGNN